MIISTERSNNMQIVIDVDENVFTRLFDNGTEDYEIMDDDLFAIAKSIRNGIPLPKGHGRLIDADKTIDLINKEIAKHDEMMAKYETYRNTQIPSWMWKGVCEETTIIEEDKE
jgi:hypothetical protein